MSLTIGSLAPVQPLSYTRSAQEAYALDNASEVSGAYTDAVRNMNDVSDIDPASPVRYANVKRVTASAPAGTLDALRNAQSVSKAYNAIAESFGGITTSYDADSTGRSYAEIGANIDLYA